MKRLFVTYVDESVDNLAFSCAVSVYSQIHGLIMRTYNNRIILSDPIGVQIRLDVYFDDGVVNLADVYAKGNKELLEQHALQMEDAYQRAGFTIKRPNELH